MPRVPRGEDFGVRGAQKSKSVVKRMWTERRLNADRHEAEVGQSHGYSRTERQESWNRPDDGK